MTDQTNKDLLALFRLAPEPVAHPSSSWTDEYAEWHRDARAALSASAPADILRMRQQLEQEWCELQKLKASYASAPAALSTGDLRDRLVAVSSAIADQDDREAQAILREAMRLLDSAPAAGSVPSDAEIDELLPLGMAPYTTLCGTLEIRRFARALLAQYGSPSWQPIETAPMPKIGHTGYGERTLLAVDCGPGTLPSVKIGWWSGHEWASDTGFASLPSLGYRVTHWMPLPPAPQEGK